MHFIFALNCTYHKTQIQNYTIKGFDFTNGMNESQLMNF